MKNVTTAQTAGELITQKTLCQQKIKQFAQGGLVRDRTALIFFFCKGLLPDSANGKELKLKSTLGTFNSNKAPVMSMIKTDRILRCVPVFH